jgi:hypothetical protein
VCRRVDGEHGDLPLEEGAGEVGADMVAQERLADYTLASKMASVAWSSNASADD